MKSHTSKGNINHWEKSETFRFVLQFHLFLVIILNFDFVGNLQVVMGFISNQEDLHSIHISKCENFFNTFLL